MNEIIASERIKKHIKNCSINLKISIVLFIPIIILIFYIINIDKFNPQDYFSFKILIQDYLAGNDILGEPAYIVVDKLFDSVATYEEDGVVKKHYCVAYDEMGYMYLISLSNSKYKELSGFIENSINDEPIDMSNIRFEGVVESIPNDLKDILIEQLEFESEEDISSYLGGVILNTMRTSNSNLSGILGIIALFGGIFNLCYFINFFEANRKTNKTLKKFENEIEQIYAEIDSKIKNEKAFLLNKYIVDYTNGLVIIKYEDIKLLYLEVYRQNYIKVDSYLKVYLNKKDVFTVFSAKNSKLTEEKQLELINDIIMKCPNAMVGYNQENLNKLNNI